MLKNNYNDTTTYKTLLYVGSSMYPTLRNLDILTVSPYDKKIPQTGDVVVFRSLTDNKKIVHRVILVENTGIKTQGDHSKTADPYLTIFNDIIGQVVSLKRGSSELKVQGGKKGTTIHSLAKFRKMMRFRRHLINFFQPVLNLVLKPNFTRRMLFGRNTPKVFIFHSSQGSEMRLLLGQKVIGRCRKNSDKWELNTRYKALVNENSLPLWETLLQDDTNFEQTTIEAVE